MFMRIGLTAAVAAAVILVACGGGDGSSSASSPSSSAADTPSAPGTPSVKVVGDSLSDSGTFGYKFTVQGKLGAPAQIWTDHVATAVAAAPLCPRYDHMLKPNPSATACTSFAVGGAGINPRGESDITSASVVQQLKDLRAQGPFKPEDFLLVSGGGNDIADLMDAFGLRRFDSGWSFLSLTRELIPAGSGGATLSHIGEAYAVKLADRLADALTAEALNVGAQRVVVLTAPDITLTPKVRGWMQSKKRQFDRMAWDGTTYADEIWDVTLLWTTAFNRQLKARLAGDPRVVVVDFHAELHNWVRDPARYGLTNNFTPACPVAMIDGTGEPVYDISTCTEALLNATPPKGDWWKSYVFSDGFHGTPRTHLVLGELVVKAIEAKGWK